MNPPFFELISPVLRSSIEAKAVLKKYKRGEVVYRQGDKPAGLYIVKKGILGLVSVSEKGNEHLLRFFRTGQLFGHRSYFSEEEYHASSTCLEASEVYFLSSTIFENLVKEDTSLWRHIVVRLARELRLAETQRVEISDHGVITRVAHALVYLKEVHPDYDWTRKEIAEFLDSTSPTIVRVLARLEERKMIALQGRKIKILDRQGLLDFADPLD